MGVRRGLTTRGSRGMMLMLIELADASTRLPCALVDALICGATIGSQIIDACPYATGP